MRLKKPPQNLWCRRKISKRKGHLWWYRRDYTKSCSLLMASYGL